MIENSDCLPSYADFVIDGLRPSLGDTDCQLANAIDARSNPVAAFQCANANRCSGKYQIAGTQRDILRQHRYDLRDGPDHLLQITVLPDVPVDRQPYPPRIRVSDF